MTNSGDRAGDEVAELYLIPPSGDGHPLQSLEGLQRVHLAPHTSAVVHFILQERELSEVDAQGHRAVRAGDYQLYVGGASPGAQMSGSGVSTHFRITGEKDLPE